MIRPAFGVVFQAFTVVSNWSPGHPQAHAASAISRRRSRAGISVTTQPVFRPIVSQISSASTDFMNSSVTRTELFAFW